MAFDLNFSVTSIPTVLPRIVGDQEVGSVWSLNETGLTGITARQWAVVGGANLGTAATQDTTGYGDQDLICTVTCDQGTLTTPPLRVYGSGHALATDLAVVDVCKHTDSTKYAVQDGDWTDVETWNGATVPVAGDHIVIPKGRTVTYDIASSSPRFDSIRVDGILTFARDQNTDMLVEHLIVSRGGKLEIGNPANRLPAAYTATITISGRDYDNSPSVASDINATRDPELWGRGIVVQGEVVMWGKDVLHGCFATAPVAAGATSLTLEETPTGWVNGDTVVICPTTFTTTGPGSTFESTTQEEERAVTISGNVLSWTDGLTFDHSLGNNQDVRPYVFLKRGRNIVIQSEVTSPAHRRGHFAAMHGAVCDLWQVSFIEMGRTDKSIPAGVKDSNGLFRSILNTETLTSTLNATRSTQIRLDYLTPYEGLQYTLSLTATDADSSSFSGSLYTIFNGASTIAYTAQAGDTWQDVANGLAADFATWIASGGRSTSVVNIVADSQGLLCTSSVTTATDTIAVYVPAAIWGQSFGATSNIQSRYPVHIHHYGLNPATVPVVVGCYVEGTPGWGFVHHWAKANFREDVAYKYWGAGMVAESGAETGQWFDCVSCKSTNTALSVNDLRARPKTIEGPYGEASDLGRGGWGFLTRSRALTFNNNKAFASSAGYVFYHRDNPADNSIGESRALTRADLDLQTIGTWTSVAASMLEISHEDYPIVHFDENLAAGCSTGIFISKSRGTQFHDVAIQISRYTAWGCEENAAEYIQHYNFAHAYSIPKSGWRALVYGGNVYHSGFFRSVSEGSLDGVAFLDSLDAEGTHNLFDNTNDPRWWAIGHTNIGITGSDVAYTVAGGRNPGADVTLVDADLYSTAINIELDPTETFPLVLGNLDPVAGTFEPPLDADGKKSDNISALQQTASVSYPNANASGGNGPCDGTKGSDEIMWRTPDKVSGVGAEHGFYTYAGEQVIVTPWIISDRVTGRPACYDKLWRIKKDGGANYTQGEIETNPGWTHNGTYTRNANAITGNDIEIRVNVNSEDNVFNIPTLASLDQGGTTTGFRLDNTWGWRDFRAPNKGTATLDVANATVTYTPFPKATGVDTMYVLARREGRYKTIAIRILIANSDSGLTTPVVDTHFSAADAGSGAMTVTLLARPDTSGRHIEYTEYSTDSGSTWRKLTNQWPLTQITVDTASDGTALGTGSKTIRLRYVTDYDYATSTASGDDTVTVT